MINKTAPLVTGEQTVQPLENNTVTLNSNQPARRTASKGSQLRTSRLLVFLADIPESCRHASLAGRVQHTHDNKTHSTTPEQTQNNMYHMQHAPGNETAHCVKIIIVTTACYSETGCDKFCTVAAAATAILTQNVQHSSATPPSLNP